MAEKARPYHHGALREALIRAGLEALEESGLAALSLRTIAARAGVSHAAPRNHFGGIEGLLTAIAAEGFRAHRAAMLPAGGSVTRQEALETAARGYVAFATGRPALFELMFSPLYCNFDDPDLSEASRESYAVLADIAQGLDWRGAAGPEGARDSERLLWSLVHGFAQLAQAGQLDGDPVEGITRLLPAFRYKDA